MKEFYRFLIKNDGAKRHPAIVIRHSSIDIPMRHSQWSSPLCSRSMVSLPVRGLCLALYSESKEVTVPRSLMKEFSNQLMILINKDPNMADQKPITSKPVITAEAIFNIRALMTKVKKPRDNILIGSVSRSAIGLKKAFRIPSMAAAKRADKNPLIWMPSSR